MRLAGGGGTGHYYKYICSINKTVLLPFCDNKCDWNKQKSVINCLQKYGSTFLYVVSLIYCIEKNKNTKFTGLNILFYG